MLIGFCCLGLTTTSLAQSKIDQPANHPIKQMQLQRLNDSLTTHITNSEDDYQTLKIKPQPKLVSNLAINLIKEFEGYQSSAYIDTNGVPVIGYGLSHVGGKSVKIGDRISPTQAEKALNQHLKEIHQELNQVLEVRLNESQFSALASISFNVGVGAIKNSTLLRKINHQDYAGAANEFLRWDKANLRGRLVQMPGLTRRRHAERQLFLNQSS